MRHNLYLALFILLDIYPFFFLRYTSFKGKYRIPYKYIVLILSALTVIQTVGFVWINNQDWANDSLVMMYRQAWVVVFFGLSLLFIKDSFFKLFYVWLLVLSYDYVIIGTSKFMSEFIIDTEDPLRIDIIVRIIQLAITYPPVFIFMSTAMRKTISFEFEVIWRYLWVIPLIFNVMDMVTLIDTDKGFDVNAIFIIFRYLMLIGCFFVTFILLKSIKSLNKQRDIEENIHLIENQLAAEREQYELINRHMEETRIQRHDFRHHVAVITELAEQGDIDKLKEYISGYNKTTSYNVPITYCRSYALNSLLCYYTKIADGNGISCEISLASCPTKFAADVDLCVVFGNLLENAIEACRSVEREKRFILVKSAIIGGMISILVENSYDGQVRKKDSIFLSRKRSDEHGIGLSSVKALTERIGGNVSITTDGKRFSVNILIPYGNEVNTPVTDNEILV